MRKNPKSPDRWLKESRNNHLVIACDFLIIDLSIPDDFTPPFRRLETAVPD